MNGEGPISKTISIGDTDSNGVQYVEEPPSARIPGLVDQKIEEVLDCFAG